MSLVAVKNLLFPSITSSLTPRNPTERSPLLPTSYRTTDSTKIGASPFCPHPDCPNIPRRASVCSSASSTMTASPATALSSSMSPPWLDARHVSDAIIGLSDGLTVPFALTAGLSAFNDTRFVIFGGCAELIAGSLSMGLGGWLAGRGEAEFYNTTLTATRKLVYSSPSELQDLIISVFSPYRVPAASITPFATALATGDPDATIDFLMAFHHSLPSSESTSRTPVSSGLTIAAGYFIGGAVPLLPYFFVDRTEVMTGLWWSVGVMAVCLFLFGIGRSFAVGEDGHGVLGRVRGGLEMMLVGGVAAGASWGIVRALGDGS